MAHVLRPFFDLLPSRIDQVISGRALRAWRVRRERLVERPAAAVSRARRRLFVDIAVLSKIDAGTGIQRVVRSVALGLIEEASSEWDIHFVSATRRRPYHCIAWPTADTAVVPEPLNARAGDVFLGLDFSLDAIRRHRKQLASFRRDGGILWFLICDLLPLNRPEWFSPNNVVRYRAWLDVLAGSADGFLCISQQTEADLNRALCERYDLTTGYRTCVLPMGHNILSSLLPDTSSNESAESQPRFDTTSRFVLMVGTLEPRKGHSDILSAFDELWQNGREECLILIGRLGWQVHDLNKRIRSHRELGRKLFWFDDVKDPELERIYACCDGVIVASLGEGFGLPLIEALGHGKPVLARDLPIFRPHADHGVRYFPAEAPTTVLSRSIELWLDDIRADRIKVVRPTGNWRETAGKLLSVITPER